MSSFTQIGFLKVDLQITVIGSLDKDKASKLQHDLMQFLAEQKVNTRGTIEHVMVDKFEYDNNYANTDTSS